MKGNCGALSICMLLGVSLLVVGTPASAAITGYGEVTDPVGDSSAASTDLVFGSVTITSTGDAIFRARYGPGYDPGTTHTSFGLDLDKNPLTGQAWFGMGADAVVGTYGTGFEGTGYYALYGPSWGTWLPTPATYLPDGVEVTVPLSVLGSADGLVNFHVASDIQLAARTFTGVQDFMPNFYPGTQIVGVGTVVPVPVPGALLLGGIGAGLVGWLRRRGTL